MLLGILAISLIVVPYIVLGKGSYVQVHDQMDGEILNYIYQAKYLFQGDSIPEFMNGMSKAAMCPPAPLGVLFYKVLSPFWAFTAMQLFVLVIGFLGMFFLLKKMKCFPFVCLAVGVLFCYLPFYPTYGLASLGQPMLVLSALYLYQNEKKLMSYGMLALYAGFSSVTLIGYVWIGLGGILTVLFLFQKKRTQAVNIAMGTGILTITYLLTNGQLIKSLFGVGGFETHRAEMALTETENLWERAKELFFQGGSYSNVYSAGIFSSAVILLLILWIRKRKSDFSKILLFTLCAIAVFVCLAVAWNCGAVVDLRNALGGIFLYFQADRIYWLFPFMWLVVLACILQIGLEYAKRISKVTMKILVGAALMVLCLIQGYQEFRDGTLNKNIRLMLVDGYEQVTWDSIYMEDVFAEIDGYVDPQKNTYSVVSIGMYPSIPLYNGYTCADGYSNNYDIHYKHQFRKIIAGELEKNEEARKLIDEWGNRLYMVSGEYGISPMIKKGSNILYHDLTWDTQAMKEMNIRYIFAAGKIENPQELGCRLVREEPFRSETSYYEIWLYELY